MKKIAAVLAMLLLLPVLPATAEGAGLEALLSRESGAEIAWFAERDYDGDGRTEAFALCGSGGEGEGYTGDIWFASETGCQRLQSGLAYLTLKALDADVPAVFVAEEGYGGSSSVSHAWIVADGQPVALAGEHLEGFSAGDAPGEFYAFPSAFDAFTDGTGHTWKRYYFYLDGAELREYGGIRVSEAEFRSLDGASAILDTELASGKTFMDAIYRGNGVVNLNFRKEDMNTNVTVRVAGNAVSYWEADSGVYELASNPSIAIYPEGFSVGAESASEAPVEANKERPRAMNEELSGGGNKNKSEKSGAEIPLDSGMEASGEANVENAGETPAEISWFPALNAPEGAGNAETPEPEAVPTEAPEAAAPEIAETTPEPAGEPLPEANAAAPAAPEGGTANLYTERGENEYGQMEDGLYVGVYDASGARTDGRALLTWATGMLREGGGINAFLWKVGDGLYYAEARFAWEGITANYLLFRHEDDALVYVNGAYDPGYSSGQALTDGVDGRTLFECEDFDQEGMLAALNEHFAENGITFALRVVDMGSGYGEAMVYSAELPEDALLATAVISSGEQEAAPEEGPEGEFVEGDPGAPGVVFTTGDVNIRVGPGLGYEVLGQMGKGARAQWLGESSVDERGVAWYRIDYNGLAGWISSMYSELEGGSSEVYESDEPYAYDYDYGRQVRASGDMNLRSEPNLNGSVLGVVLKGDRADYLEESSVDERGVRWYLVNYRGLTGWVSSTYAVLEN